MLQWRLAKDNRAWNANARHDGCIGSSVSIYPTALADLAILEMVIINKGLDWSLKRLSHLVNVT